MCEAKCQTTGQNMCEINCQMESIACACSPKGGIPLIFFMMFPRYLFSPYEAHDVPTVNSPAISDMARQSMNLLR